MTQFEQYWPFAAVCVTVALFMIRLVMSERVTLQGSLSFLVLLGLGAGMGLFPNWTSWLAVRLGFGLPSNFFFSVSIGALAVLHVHSLIMNSRVQIRSIALTQELAIVQERLDQLQRDLRARERQSA
jgi:hypothetical protein